MPEARPISVRAPRQIHQRLEAAAARAGVTKSAWILAALLTQLDEDEAVVHVPEAVAEALPRRIGSRIAMPSGRIPSVIH